MPEVPPAAAAVQKPFRPRTPVVIGILGGVAAGKSAVAAIFAGHGLRHVDADAISRTVAQEPEVVAAIADAFGPGVRGPGGIDRQALGRLVFADEAVRKRLEAILHPLIQARIEADLAAARRAGASALLDAPLLLETGLDRWCDHLVFLDVDAATRERRANARGWPAGEVARREAAQLPLDEKRARAGHTVRNDTTLAVTAREVALLLDRLAAAQV